MSEPTVAQPEAANSVAKPEPDLLTKVSQFKKAEPAVAPVDSGPDIGFDYKELEGIKDPIAKEVAIKAYKSMQAGFTKKTQGLAEKEKTLEQKLIDSQKFTPQRIQELLNNPEFVQSAHIVASSKNPSGSGLTDEEYSALSEPEKRRISTLESELSSLKQVNFQATISQEDEKLKSRFTDYEPVLVENGIRDLSKLQPHQLREHVYKSIKHDEHVKNAYELGKQEALKLKQEKVNGISVNGYDANQANDIPERNKGETDQSYMARLTLNRLAQSRK